MSNILSWVIHPTHLRTGLGTVCAAILSKPRVTVSVGCRQTPVARRGVKTRSSSAHVNPLLELQAYVATPIVPAGKVVFCPLEEELLRAQTVFSPTAGSRRDAATFVGSYVDGQVLPQTSLPEIAFLGQSNVGKSSLIRSLLSQHTNVDVRVSKKPGHTKTLNLYSVGRHFTLVDMPGYGFNMPQHFQQSVETYLASRQRLCRTFLLLDGEVGPTATDLTALHMLHEFGVPYVAVITKIDKVGRHMLLRNVLSVMDTCQNHAGHTCFSQPFLVSAMTMDGIMLLQTFIAYITGCVHIKGLCHH